MSQLLPIPADSAAARGISRMEEVLRRLRQVPLEQGFAERFFAHDASRGGQGVKFSELFVSGEGRWDWQEFYHYHGLSWRSRQYGETQTFRTDQGPSWVKFSTEDRLAWGRLLPLMLRSLDGLHVSVSQDTSWRWDRQHPRPNGSATYVPVYQAMVALRQPTGLAFDAKTAVPSLLGRHCMAEHPLADRHLFDWQQDVFGQLLFRSYGWHRDGFWAQFHLKREMEQACQTMFEGLPHTVEKIGKGGNAHWLVVVDLSKASEASKHLQVTPRPTAEAPCLL